MNEGIKKSIDGWLPIAQRVDYEKGKIQMTQNTYGIRSVSNKVTLYLNTNRSLLRMIEFVLYIEGFPEYKCTGRTIHKLSIRI